MHCEVPYFDIEFSSSNYATVRSTPCLVNFSLYKDLYVQNKKKQRKRGNRVKKEYGNLRGVDPLRFQRRKTISGTVTCEPQRRKSLQRLPRFPFPHRLTQILRRTTHQNDKLLSSHERNRSKHVGAFIFVLYFSPCRVDNRSKFQLRESQGHLAVGQCANSLTNRSSYGATDQELHVGKVGKSIGCNVAGSSGHSAYKADSGGQLRRNRKYSVMVVRDKGDKKSSVART